MAIHQTNDEQLKKDFTEKLSKFLSEPAKVYQTYTPIDPITDEEFIKAMYEKIFDYYKKWKTGSSSVEVISAINDLKEKWQSYPKETDKTNPKLLLEDLLNLSIKRIEHLEKLMEKKIELIKSI